MKCLYQRFYLQNKKMKKYFLFTVYSLLFTVLSCKPNLKNPKPSAGNADFSKFVALGGTFMAGYQDWSLNKTGQTYSIPALLSTEFQMVGGGSFSQPLMPDNSGIGFDSKTWEHKFLKSAYLNYVADCKGVTSLMPIVNSFPISSGGIYTAYMGVIFQNLSVPYAKISDYNNSSLGISGNTNP